MSKYLEYFKGAFDASVTEKIKPKNKPYVAYSEEEGVIYTTIPEVINYDPYVTFTAEEDGSSIGLAQLSTNQTLEYSTDTTTWNTFNKATDISLNNGDKVYVRGVLSADNASSDYTQFKMSGKIAVSGNCNAIWNYQDLNAPLKAYCGRDMFKNCKSLTTAPVLPATTLANSCYYSTFNGCTSLTTAPELPATVLAKDCYAYMFSSCTSLTTAPELPATALVSTCYCDMFKKCTSLTAAPVLPATILAEYCYHEMFYECTNLNHITCLATNKSAKSCTKAWVYGISSDGTFVKHPDMNSWSTGYYEIPVGWTVVDAEL